MYRGIVVSGRGLAVPAMSRPVTEQAIARMTGLKIVPGTLNVRLDKPFTGKLSRYVSVKELGGIPDIPNRKGLRFGAIRIAGRFAGFAFQGDEPEYSLSTWS